VSNKKQFEAKAIVESTTAEVAKPQARKSPFINKRAVIITKHTFADAIGKAQAEALRKTFA
jgi:hypothetical protein